MARNYRTCSFCGRDATEVEKLIHGPGNVSICNECVKTCQEILKSSGTGSAKVEALDEIPTPHEIKDFLDEYVIGQDEAKKVLSVAEAGYVGEDVENILLKLIQAADDNIAEAERGIIFIDEIDKISKKGENVSITRDVSGEGVQQALLKIIEGTVASVPPQGGRKHPNQEMLKIDTHNILFICGGAFVGLDKIIERRVSNQAMGFGSSIESFEDKSFDELFKELHPDDLVKFGLIPEFIGRLPIHVSLNNLTKEDLKRIITEPKNSILKQYIVSMSLDGVELTFEDGAIDAIAQKAIDQNTGARGIRSIVENLMLAVSYDVPSSPDIKSITITADCVNGSGKPLIGYRTEKLGHDS